MNRKYPNILLIEDNEELNALIQIRFKRLNIEITGVHTEKEAIEWCRHHIPDLLLMDYKLNETNAKNILENLHEKGYRIPFIIMTGHGDQSLAVEMMKLGAIDYLVKDISFIDKLPPVVDRAIKYIETKKQLELSQLEIIKNEEKYRSIFNNIQDIYFEISLKGIILEISPSVETSLFYTREEMIGRQLIDYLVEYENSHRLLRHFQSGDKIDSFEILIQDKNGDIRDCSVLCNFIYNKFVGTVRDITDKKKMERKILHAVIETEEKERRRISQDLHDGIGPLLSSVKMYVNLLKKEVSLDKKKEDIVHHINELIDDSIDNIRSIANNLTPNILNDFGLIEAIRSFCGKVGVDHVVSFQSNMTDKLDMNIEIILYRIIQELVNNTIKHAGAKSISIDLMKTKDMVELNYHDDGNGCSIDNIITGNQSTGMGLRNIMNKLKSINAIYNFKSLENKGFHFTLKFII